MRRLAAICPASTVCLAWFCATGLFAQPAGAPPVGSDIREGPRFVVKAKVFAAKDETGWDFWGHDEVVIVFRTPTYALVGSEYGYIDSDSDHPTAVDQDQNCITPAIDPIRGTGKWACSDAGVNGPITFSVAFYEQDANPLGWLWHLFPASFNAPQQTGRGEDIFSPVVEFPQEKSPNDLIGKVNVKISLETLLQKLPRVGDSYQDKVSLYGGCETPCTSGDSTEYEMSYEVRRVRDVSVPVNR